MSDVALTNIKYGTEDGTVIDILFGEDVSELPQDVIDELKEQGLIDGEPVLPVSAPEVEEVEDDDLDPEDEVED